MRLPRFTILSLLLLILFVGVAVAGLRAADDSWDAGLLGLTILILLTSVLLAVHRIERKRAFWLGFALFGWVYFVVSMIPPLESRMPTTKGLAFIDSKIPGRQKTWIIDLNVANSSGLNSVQTLAFSPQGNTLSISSPGKVQVWDTWSRRLLSGSGGSTENFLRIGHSILAWVLAFVGGGLSRWLYEKDRDRVMRPIEMRG